MLNKKLSHIFTLHSFYIGIGRYFTQSTCQSQRILGHLCRTCICQILAFARNGKAHQDGKEITDSRNQHGQQKNQSRPSLVITFTCKGRIISRAQCYLCQHRENSHKHDGDDKQTYIMITDMRQFMGYNCLQFFIIQLLNDTFRQCYGITLFIYTTGISIQWIIIYDVDFRHRHPLTHTKILHQIIDTFIFFPFQRSGTRSSVDDGSIGKVGNQKPNEYASQYIRSHFYK